MRNSLFETPSCMIMGFHYTRQFSRRSRVKVVGLVDQSTETWERWYLRMHEEEAVKRIADAGYNLMEVHFLYGFGLAGEREEYELTRRIVKHAHRHGIQVLGYFQFFSVQSELFFPENPWARECLQLKSDGTPHEYAYNRPALCFTHEKVRQYYLEGIERGLSYCDLDGIRLDNDYFRGCYCENCQHAFRKYLHRTFDEQQARRVFGIPHFEGVSLVPIEKCDDPLWAAMVRFRQSQRQDVMRLLSRKVAEVKPGAVLGGIPAVSRGPKSLSLRHVYPPDLGETHHLVCAENSQFPARTGNSIRHQVEIYKFGQSSDFAVYPSHHLHRSDGRIRWPETREECALSLCEALCFGGHVACTTWGLRMDEGEDRILFERPEFLAALEPVQQFLAEHGSLYRGARCNAAVGVYINRESLACDSVHCWYSLQGLLQILLTRKIPFRFVDRDTDELLDDLQVLVVPDIRLASNEQLARIAKFAETGRVLLTGESFAFDEFFIRREGPERSELMAMANVLHLVDTPERADESEMQFRGTNPTLLPMPEKADAFSDALAMVWEPAVNVEATPFVTIDTFDGANGELLIHILNYDNETPADVGLEIQGSIDAVEVIGPGPLGPGDAATVHTASNRCRITIPQLHTYAVVQVVR